MRPNEGSEKAHVTVSLGPLPDGRFKLRWDTGQGVVSEETISADLADVIFRMLICGAKETHLPGAHRDLKELGEEPFSQA